jgi:hypothetical protein
MSYAVAVNFYGWANDDAVKIVLDLTQYQVLMAPDSDDESRDDSDNDSCLQPIDNVHQISHDYDVKSKLQQMLNPILSQYGLTFDLFFGGLQSTKVVPYVSFKNCHYFSSDNDDDIEDTSFTDEEMSEFINQGSRFKSEHQHLPHPKLMSLIVSDSK